MFVPFLNGAITSLRIMSGTAAGWGGRRESGGRWGSAEEEEEEEGEEGEEGMTGVTFLGELFL